MSSVSNEWYIIFSENRKIKDLKKRWFTYFREDDIILAKITPCMENGKCAIAKHLMNGIWFWSSEFHVFWCQKTKILPEYLFSLLNQEKIRKIAETNMTGTSGHRRVPIEFYEKLDIPLPPLDIQEQIVREMEEVEKREMEMKKRIEKQRWDIAELMRSVNGKDEKLENIAVLLKRGKSAKYGDSRIQIIKSGQARWLKEFDFRERHFIEQWSILDERKLQRWDILINSTGVGTAWRVTLFDLEGDFVVDTHVTILRVDRSKTLPDFVLQSLTKIGFKNIEAMATGQSGQIELSLGIIWNIKIPLPPLSEQQRIVTEIEKIEDEISRLESELTTIPSQKEFILKKYLA